MASPSVLLGEAWRRSGGMSLPWCVTLPARGPVLPAHLVLAMRASGLAARACAVTSSAKVLLRAVLLRLPPPARGRCGEFDGGPICSFGFGRVSFASFCALQHRSWEAVFLSTTLATGDDRPISKAPLWPICKPVKGSGVCLTSFVRPLSRSTSTLNVSKVASGFVPASEHDGGSSDLRLDGGDREGPICTSLAFSEVFPAFARDPFVISILWGPL
jgi:hypothetical protein